MLDYSGCVLYNWALLDEKGPVDMNNARMLRRFTGEIRRPSPNRLEIKKETTHFIVRWTRVASMARRRRIAAGRRDRPPRRSSGRRMVLQDPPGHRGGGGAGGGSLE